VLVNYERHVHSHLLDLLCLILCLLSKHLQLHHYLSQRGSSVRCCRQLLLILQLCMRVKLLCELHLLQRIHGLDECHRYSLGPGHGHHLVCTRCGTLERFDKEEALLNAVENRRLLAKHRDYYAAAGEHGIGLTRFDSV